jgi:hypothetical protein
VNRQFFRRKSWWSIFHPYHSENTLIFNKIIRRSVWYYTHTLKCIL